MSIKKHWCEGDVRDTVLGFGHVKCLRNGAYEYDGHWYCKTHDPRQVALRREKRDTPDKEIIT